MPPDIRLTMFLPPDDTLRVWEMRGDLRPTVRWHEMMHEDHAAHFTVAKVAKLDLLRAIRTSLDNTLRGGGTFESWKRDIVPQLQKAGWWGVVTDAELTGTAAPVIVNERRLQTIFNTNVRMSQAAAAWSKIQAEKELFPFLRYLSDHWRKDPRKDHQSWHGLILPVDHPWWQTHFPPNGWGCRCHYEQVSQARMERNGWKVSEPPDDGPPRDFFAAGRTAPIPVPAGIHPGFGYNPGIAHLRAVSEKTLDSVRRAADAGQIVEARAIVRAIVDDAAFEQFLALPEGSFPVAVLDEADRLRIAARSNVIVLPTNVYRKQLGQLPGFAGHPELTVDDYRALPDIIANALVIAQEGASKLVYFSRGGRLYKAIVRQDAGEEWPAVVSIHRSQARKIDGETRRLEIIYDGREP